MVKALITEAFNRNTRSNLYLISTEIKFEY